MTGANNNQLAPIVSGADLIPVFQSDWIARYVPVAQLLSGVGLWSQVNTQMSTAGAFIPAAQMVNGVLLRSGPTANYSDTTDTAANIILAMLNAQVGSTCTFRHYNNSGFTQTFIAGAGVTMAGLFGVGSVALNTYKDFLITVISTTTPAVTMTAIGTGTR